ncbi:MAG: nucleoside triphosphate pyrophosphohydrolase [Rikenellaceae bacterium]|jgi:XTP/dITP diphosphohydrolase|nr:nucleoside triphosphate pyrophosphohydrolase [Rikenellaceae bacterium]
MEKQTALDAFGRLLDIMDRLRVECPWDRKQTFESLRNNTIEETYELVDAITGGDLQQVRGELGDLLLHVVFYAKMGDEKGEFNMADVCNSICDKLVYRHPHVFGQVDADTPEKVKQNWEDLKQTENGKRKSVLDGVPKSLPAMVKAYRIGEKAASAGFDWKNPHDVWEKVSEEIGEVGEEIAAAPTPGASQAGTHLEEEFGDLFFALVNAARLYGVDPENALERCNRKFISRFTYLEQTAKANSQTLRDMSLEQMEEIWQQAKQVEKENTK